MNKQHPQMSPNGNDVGVELANFLNIVASRLEMGEEPGWNVVKLLKNAADDIRRLEALLREFEEELGRDRSGELYDRLQQEHQAKFEALLAAIRARPPVA